MSRTSSSNPPAISMPPRRIANLCELTLPHDASVSIQDDGTVTEIELKTMPLTSIYMGWYDIPEECRGDIGAWLMGRMEYFVEHCIKKAIKEGNAELSDDLELSVTAEQWLDDRTGYLVCQAVAHHDVDANWWVARLISIPEGNAYFLMDWNGPRLYTDSLVVPIFESFRSLIWRPDSASSKPIA